MIRVDSRKVQKGDIFVAIKGLNFDGHEFAIDAEKRGASKIYCEKEIQGLSIPQEIVKNSRIIAASLASEYWGNPSKSFKLIGITGTNGKTTITYMVKSILESLGHKVGLIGTIQNMIGQKQIHTEYTTPESVDLQELFAHMRDEACEYVVMEVSSHAIAQNRIASSDFEVAAFTNLTQDHLDFHKTMNAYFEVKSKLFELSKYNVINIDNIWGEKLAKKYPKNTLKVSSSDITFPLPSHIVGKFNLENAAIARGIVKSLRLTDKQIMEGFYQFQGVLGRMEVVHDSDFKVIIDYAHTPDGLKNILKTAREFTKGRLIILFGCGGDRDRGKRPIMGKIASELADFVIVTNDNPRTENPESIIKEIVQGMSPCEKTIITNRKEAIEFAIKNVQKDDVLILAGKGHEDYQIIGKEKSHFDEHEIIQEIITRK